MKDLNSWPTVFNPTEMSQQSGFSSNKAISEFVLCMIANDGEGHFNKVWVGKQQQTTHHIGSLLVTKQCKEIQRFIGGMNTI